MPLLWLSLAFLAGILLADLISLSMLVWCLLAGGCFLLQITTFLLRRRRAEPASSAVLAVPGAVLLLALCLGAARYQAAQPDLSDPALIANFTDGDQRLALTGVVVAFPDRRDAFTLLQVQVSELRPVGGTPRRTPVHGLVLARTDSRTQYHYGQRVLVSGYLQTPPELEGFSYRDYLARQGILALVPDARVTVLESGLGRPFLRAVYAVRERALATVYRLWPDPEAALFAGILLGIETGIPQPVERAFQETGTSHIIAISGFNITIISALFATGFNRWLGARRGTLAALVGIGLYTVLVGADAAVLRAALMGGLALLAALIGRRQQGLNALALTAALLSLLDPHLPWDIGFQLSFMATLGLVLYAGPLSAAFIRLLARFVPLERARQVAGPVGEYFLYTLAAQVTTLPLLAYHFGRISLSALLANPVILPCQPPVMVLGGLAVLLGVIWAPLGRLLAPLAWPFLLFTIRAVEVFARLRGGSLELGEFSLLWLLGFYGLLLSLTFGWWRLALAVIDKQAALGRALPLPLLAAAGLGALLVWGAAWRAPDGRLHLAVLDVGSGEALLLRSPTGRYLLINGGPSTNLLSDGLGRRLPPFQRRLDWLVLGSLQAEDLAGISRALPRFPPAQALWAGIESPSRTADDLRATLSEMQVPITAAAPGQVLDLGGGARLQVLTVCPRGAILLLEMGDFRALLPLGAAPEDLEALAMGRQVGRVSVLLLAEHGYAPLNPPEWIANLNPQLVLLPVAAGDPHGRPDPETLQALAGYSLLRSDQNGWIQVVTDGQSMWVEVAQP